MKNWSVTFTVPISATRPTSLRPRSSSIRCSARSFGSASSSSSSALSSCGVAPRGRVPAIGRMVTLPSRTRTRISGLEPATAKPPKSRKIQERRRVDPAQRAVERERRQRERRLEALRQHDLEDVAGRDVFLGARAPSRLIFVRRRVRGRRHGRAGRRARRRPPCRADGRARRRSPMSRSTARAERGLGGDAGLGPHRRHDGDRVLHGVEHDRRCVGRIRIASGMPIGSGLGARQLLHQPHHVVAEIAEQAGRHRRQLFGQRDAAFGDQRAQRVERRLGAGREAVRLGARRAVDLGARAVRAPDQVGLEPDDRIAAAHRAAFDRFEQEAHWRARRRSSGTPRPAFRGRRPAWSTPPAARRAHSAPRRRRRPARSASSSGRAAARRRPGAAHPG